MNGSLISPVVLFPLMGAILSYLIGRKNKDLSGWVATAASTLAFLWGLNLVLGLPANGGAHEEVFFQWLGTDSFSADFTFRFDRLTAVMALVVTGIGSLIHLYSIGYMAEDEGRPRFFSYLNLFMFSMLLLILGGNLLVLFVGWEGVGLCSYLLIGFWFTNEEYAKAGRKAFVVNRIGDAGFLLGIFLLFGYLGTVDFIGLKEQVTSMALVSGDGIITLAAFCLFVGATGKSAQIPLFVWLPDAMAGPTPVSALIHAATMVTAGVYLLARMFFVFELAPDVLSLVTIISVLTAFIAATTALVQHDIKKVLAYSTVSQLGFMFMAASVGAFWVAIFHVVTHAFFKACLFLGAGSVIHGCHHEQDMREMGGLRKLMPVTYWTYLIATLAIAGIAPFAGYYSKHAIVAALAQGGNPFIEGSAVYIGYIVSFTAFLTAFYMTRSLVLTFWGEYRGHAHPHESPWHMCVPLVVLMILSTAGGMILLEVLPEYLSPVLPIYYHPHHETLVARLLHSWLGLAALLLAAFIYTKKKDLAEKVYNLGGAISRCLSEKYYFDEIYGALVVQPLQNIAAMLWHRVDNDIIDFSVNGAGWVVDSSGEVVRYTQTGQVRHYATMIFLAVLIVLLFCFLL